MSLNAHAFGTQQSSNKLDKDFIYVGDNDTFKVYYDKNVTFNQHRKQVVVYLLVEAHTPRDYVREDRNGNKTYKYKFMVQKTIMDCERQTYISDLVTFFNADDGSIIQDGTDGSQYKVNKNSLVGKVFTTVCKQMKGQ